MNKILHKFKKHKKIADEHIEPKLYRRLKIFTGIISIIIIIVFYKIFLNQITITLAFFGFIGGTSLGFIAGRMFKMSWNNETQKVVSRLDKIGIILLILYIAIEIGRKWLFGHWLQGAQLNAFGLTFLSGLLFGRLLSMSKNIKKVLEEQEKIYQNKNIGNII